MRDTGADIGADTEADTEADIEVGTPTGTETVFTWGGPALKFGAGAVAEIGYDVAQLGASRVLVLTDPGVAATGVPDRVVDSLRAAGLAAELFTGVHVEPTDQSIAAAVDFARDGGWDGFVGVGGGSAIDTAKAVDLLTSHPADLADYLNAPIGKGLAPAGPLAPLVAVPTTAGTGAESTAVCVLDVLDLRVKTGISHPRLRPALAVVDPEVTLTLPPGVTAATGFDILCHALESYTARPYDAYPKRRPEERVAYCGANPVSDVWIRQTLPLLARSFRTAHRAGDDLAARTDMLQAALFAGLGFGNAGVHIPHACAYPIAGRVRDFRPPDYPDAEPMVPHGMSVVLTAPAAFRRTYEANPERHLWAAHVLDPETDAVAEPCERLPAAVTRLMRDTGMPNGLSEVGYAEADIADLVDGASRQHRLLSIAPIDVGDHVLADVLKDSLTLW
ncbi:hydroxyacid-oxoacid transhydrogenase [Actinopolymorpha rutila]|uniref:hydroxyacid-oxoacid transhydrogenase n=1 Tax=Actinopolymorpha rutila TaxID=446787 RepID=A0A852ZN39_9ACTN|nr:hydroxyacid-oxoacid transhydrogenase [Actinopolymorpha rutila]NYH89856.1 alcohol dehydrogenase class IV [Actinopolymorpha rutila]